MNNNTHLLVLPFSCSFFLWQCSCSQKLHFWSHLSHLYLRSSSCPIRCACRYFLHVVFQSHSTHCHVSCVCTWIVKSAFLMKLCPQFCAIQKWVLIVQWTTLWLVSSDSKRKLSVHLSLIGFIQVRIHMFFSRSLVSRIVCCIFHTSGAYASVDSVCSIHVCCFFIRCNVNTCMYDHCFFSFLSHVSLSPNFPCLVM